MQLQRVTERDLAEIVDLTNLAFRGNQGWTIESKYIEGQRINLEMLQEDMKEHPEAMLLIWRDESAGTLFGSVWLEPKEGGVWSMGLLAVRPEEQGQQLGRRMLEASEAAMRERGAEKVVISVVNVRKRLIDWYERRGYVRTGEMKPFPYGDERVGRPLRDDLEFVILEKVL
jgi:ribosomal protein S18 acetylase RimI-like enzyme